MRYKYDEHILRGVGAGDGRGVGSAHINKTRTSNSLNNHKIKRNEKSKYEELVQLYSLASVLKSHAKKS